MKFSTGFCQFGEWLTNAISRDKTACLLLFSTALILRLLPELLVPAYPIGFETITIYAPAMIQPDPISINVISNFINHIQFVSVNRPLADTFRAGPLFYTLIWLVSDISGFNSFLLLKATGPLLYGFLALSFFIFTRRGLGIEPKIAFVTTILLIFQPATLKDSGDRYRTILALIFLFATLVVLKKQKSGWKWIGAPILALLTVLSRDYVGVLLIIIVVGWAIYEKTERIKAISVIIPSVTTLFVMFNPVWLNPNHLSVISPFYGLSYEFAAIDAIKIFAICFLPMLPLIVKGFRRSHLLDPMAGWLLLGSFSFILLPWFAVPGYNRWILLLVYPFCIYAIWGLLGLNLGKRRKRIIGGVVLTFIIIGTGYSTGAFSYVGVFSNSYVGTNLVQSSIPWDQIDDVKNVLSWLQKEADHNTALLIEERFYGWAMLILEPNNDKIILKDYGANSQYDPALREAIDENYSQIFFIWFKSSNPPNFSIAYYYEDIAVFRYSGL